MKIDELFHSKEIPTENSWTSLLNSLDKFSDDFMNIREQPLEQNRKNLLFE